MEITIQRNFKKQGYTIGSLLIGDKWFCNTLEPAVGSATESVTAGSGKAIAEGQYDIRLVWNVKFHKYLPMLEEVPGRIGILIHAGNNPRDSTGCILVGKNTQVGKVLQSRATLNALVDKIDKALISGEAVQVVIK